MAEKPQQQTTIELAHILERETQPGKRGKAVFGEKEEKGSLGPAVPSLYITKSAWARIGNPKEIDVTIKAVPEGKSGS